MFSIRCPLCDEMVYLALADWEEFIDHIDHLNLGKTTRIGLVCLNCHTDFLLQVSLSQVVK